MFKLVASTRLVGCIRRVLALHCHLAAEGLLDRIENDGAISALRCLLLIAFNFFFRLLPYMLKFWKNFALTSTDWNVLLRNGTGVNFEQRGQQVLKLRGIANF